MHDDLAKTFCIPDTYTYVLGAFSRPVSVLSQQIRSLNLIEALESRGDLDGRELHIFGAGIAGLTAAAAAIRRRHKVTLYDTAPVLFSTMRSCETRYLHPNLMKWPAQGWGESFADLPVLAWTSGRASDVINQLEQQWNSEFAESSLLTAHIPWDRNFARFGGVGDKVVLLAVGFGQDRSEYTPGYWRNDDFHQPNSIRRRFVLCGAGDGACADLLRISLTDSRPSAIVGLLSQIDGDVARNFQELCVLVDNHRIHSGHDFSAEDLTAKVDSYFTESSFSSLDSILDSMLRRDTETVHVAPRYPLLFHSAMPLHRLLVWRLHRVAEDRRKKGGDGSIVLCEGNFREAARERVDGSERIRCTIDEGGNDRSEYCDDVVIRIGVDREEQPIYRLADSLRIDREKVDATRTRCERLTFDSQATYGALPPNPRKASYIAATPPNAESFVGRMHELRVVESEFASHETRIHWLKGGPATGKTFLVARFIQNTEKNPQLGPWIAPFWWSFYYDSNEDLFVHTALRHLANQIDVPKNNQVRTLGDMLANGVRGKFGEPRRVILVLDGLERLAARGAQSTGTLGASHVAQLLADWSSRDLGEKTCPGYVIVTSSQGPENISPRLQTSHLLITECRDMEPSDGLKLLLPPNRRPSDKAIAACEAIVRLCIRRPLALALLGVCIDPGNEDDLKQKYRRLCRAAGGPREEQEDDTLIHPLDSCALSMVVEKLRGKVGVPEYLHVCALANRYVCERDERGLLDAKVLNEELREDAKRELVKMRLLGDVGGRYYVTHPVIRSFLLENRSRPERFKGTSGRNGLTNKEIHRRWCQVIRGELKATPGQRDGDLMDLERAYHGFLHALRGDKPEEAFDIYKQYFAQEDPKARASRFLRKYAMPQFEAQMLRRFFRERDFYRPAILREPGELLSASARVCLWMGFPATAAELLDRAIGRYFGDAADGGKASDLRHATVCAQRRGFINRAIDYAIRASKVTSNKMDKRKALADHARLMSLSGEPHDLVEQKYRDAEILIDSSADDQNKLAYRRLWYHMWRSRSDTRYIADGDTIEQLIDLEASKEHEYRYVSAFAYCTAAFAYRHAILRDPSDSGVKMVPKMVKHASDALEIADNSCHWFQQLMCRVELVRCCTVAVWRNVQRSVNHQTAIRMLDEIKDTCSDQYLLIRASTACARSIFFRVLGELDVADAAAREMEQLLMQGERKFMWPQEDLDFARNWTSSDGSR